MGSSVSRLAYIFRYNSVTRKERWEKRHGTAKVTGPSATVSTTSRARSAGPRPSHSRVASRPALKERSVQSWLSSLPSPNGDDVTTSARRAKPPKPVSDHSYDQQEHQEDLSASQHPPPSHSSVKHPLERHTRHSECNSCTKSDHHAHCAVEPKCHSTYATHSQSHHGHDPCNLPAPAPRCGVRTSCRDQEAYDHGCSCQISHVHRSFGGHAQISHAPHHPPCVSALHMHDPAGTGAIQHGLSQLHSVTARVHSGRAKRKGDAENAAEQTKSNQTRSAHTSPSDNKKESASHGNHKSAGVKTDRSKAGIHCSFVFNTTNVYKNASIHGPTHHVDARNVQNNLNVHINKASMESHKQNAKKTGAAQAPSFKASKHGGAAGTSQITHQANEVLRQVVDVAPLRKGLMHTPPKPSPGNLLEYPGRHDGLFSGRRPGDKGDETALVHVR